MPKLPRIPNLYQVTIYDKVGRSYVDATETVDAALQTLFNSKRPLEFEPDAPDMGIWLVELPRKVAKQLERDSYLKIGRGQYELESEMP